MSDSESQADLVKRLQQRDAQAAEMLFERYAQRLTRLAEQHLTRKLAAKLDGEDVVQSVFRTFFRRSAQGEFRIDSSAQIWKLLVKITLRKVWAKRRHHAAKRRHAGEEVTAGEGDWLPEAVAHEPSPDEAATLVDQIERLLQGLPPLYCHVLELRLQGHSVAGIATQLNVSRQTIYRALELLQSRLTRAQAEEA